MTKKARYTFAHIIAYQSIRRGIKE